MLRDRNERFYAKEPVGHLPYRTAPRCGLYCVQGTTPATAPNNDSCDPMHRLSTATMSPIPCTSCTVFIQVTARTKTYRVRTTHTLTEATRRALLASTPSGEPKGMHITFFFPFSECGSDVEALAVCVNDAPVFGEIARARRRDGRLIASRPDRKAAFLGETSDLSDDSSGEERSHDRSTKGSPPTQRTAGRKLLFYYVVETVYLDSRALSDTSGKTRTVGSTTDHHTEDINLEVSWRCRLKPDPDPMKSGPVDVLFSLFCAPRYPDSIRVRALLPTSDPVRVVSPNARNGVVVHSSLAGNTADVHFKTVAGDALKNYALPGDYLFVVQLIQAAQTKGIDDLSTWGVTVIILLAALMIWLLLTKDLTL